MATLKRLRGQGWSVGGWIWLPVEQKVGVPLELAALSFFRKFVSSLGGLFGNRSGCRYNRSKSSEFAYF